MYDLLNKKCKYLSGGERQRVKIIIELCKDTKILLCDEIISGLDEEISRKILSILKEKSKTKLIIITSHNEDIIKDFTNQIITLDHGKIISIEVNETIDNEEISISNSLKKKIKFKDLFSVYFKMMNKTSFILFSLILSILILLVSIVIEAATYNSKEEKYNSIARNFPYAYVGDYYYTNNRNKDDYINTLKKNGFEDYYLYEDIILNNFVNDPSYTEGFSSEDDFNIDCSGINYNIETMEKLNLKLINGEIPKKSNEVLISEFFLWMMKHHGFKNDNISIEKENITINNVIGLEMNLENSIFNKLKIVGVFSTGSTEEDFKIYDKNHLFESYFSFLGFDRLLLISPDYNYYSYSNINQSNSDYILYNIDTINNDYILCGEIKNDDDIIINIELFNYFFKYTIFKNFKLNEVEKEAFPNCETLYDVYELSYFEKLEYNSFFDNFDLPIYASEDFDDRLCYYIFLNCYDRFISFEPKIEVGNKTYNVVGAINSKTELYWQSYLVSKEVFDEKYNSSVKYSAIVYLGGDSKTVKEKMENSRYFEYYLETWPIKREFLDFDHYAHNISNPSNIVKLIFIFSLLFTFNIFLYVNLSYKKSETDIKILIEAKESIKKISLMKTFVFFVSLIPFIVLTIPILLLFNEIINPIICKQAINFNRFNTNIVFRLFNYNYMTIIWCIIAFLIIMFLYFAFSYYKIWRIKIDDTN